VGFTFGSGSLKATETGLNGDADFSEQTVWLTLSYQMKTSLGKIGKELLK